MISARLITGCGCEKLITISRRETVIHCPVMPRHNVSWLNPDIDSYPNPIKRTFRFDLMNGSIAEYREEIS